MAKLRSVETKIVKDDEKALEAQAEGYQDVKEEMMNRLRIRKMISHQLPRDTRKPAQILQSL